MRDLGVGEIGVFRRRPNAQCHTPWHWAVGRLRGGLRGGLGGGLVVGCMAERVAEGGGDAVSYLVHRSRAARPKLLQHRGCHKAAVMKEFTATRPPLLTLAQAVEDARGVWRRRCAARLARAASGMSQAPACSCRITQRREGDAPRQRIDCLGGGRRGWLDFKNGLYSALHNPRVRDSFPCAKPCRLLLSDRATRLPSRACVRRWRRC
jgi:hypothetical protein